MKLLVLLIGCLVACSARISIDTQTDTHTHTHTHTHKPTTVTLGIYACGPRVNYEDGLIYFREKGRRVEDMLLIRWMSCRPCNRCIQFVNRLNYNVDFILFLVAKYFPTPDSLVFV